MNTNDNAPLIAAGGGVVLFVSLFLNWFLEASAWEIFDLTDILLAVLALLAIAVGGSTAAGNPVGVPPAALSTGGLVGLGMVVTYVFEADERGFGIFLSLLAVIAIIVGALGLARGAAAPTSRTPSAPPPASPPPSAGP